LYKVTLSIGSDLLKRLIKYQRLISRCWSSNKSISQPVGVLYCLIA